MLYVNKRLITAGVEAGPGQPDEAIRIGKLPVEFIPPTPTLEYLIDLLLGSKGIFQPEVKRFCELMGLRILRHIIVNGFLRDGREFLLHSTPFINIRD